MFLEGFLLSVLTLQSFMLLVNRVDMHHATSH